MRRRFEKAVDSWNFINLILFKMWLKKKSVSDLTSCRLELPWLFKILNITTEKLINPYYAFNFPRVTLISNTKCKFKKAVLSNRFTLLSVFWLAGENWQKTPECIVLKHATIPVSGII